LEEVLLLRQEVAKLMGYKDYASYELEVKMAKDTKTVFNFLNDLIHRLDKPARKEKERLLGLKKQEKEKRGEPFDGVLRIWDMQYYHNMLLENEYQINQELIKEYFPLQKVTDGMLDIFAEILGMKFQPLSSDETHVWHEDVKQFIVLDSDSNQFIGHLYLDLFPR
jgi:Zn-dependent oligopeptidase